MLNFGSNIVVHECFSSGGMLSFSSKFNWKLWLMSWFRLASVRPRRVLSFGVWTRPRRMTLTMKERSGTTRSLRTRNRRSLTPPPFDFWFPLEQSPRGGPAGEGMWVMVAGTSRAAAAPGWRCLGKAFVAVQEMLHIPQRHYICPDGCSRANLRRRGGLPPAEPQVRQKRQRHPPLILAFHPLLHFCDFFIQSSSHISWGRCLRANYCLVFVLSLSHLTSADFCGCAHLEH